MSESPFDAPGEMVLINAKGGGRSSAMSRMMSATSALGQNEKGSVGADVFRPSFNSRPCHLAGSGI
jgi:hypothetical protein